jgi:peptide/nickel transport system substrate-binding protein
VLRAGAYAAGGAAAYAVLGSASGCSSDGEREPRTGGTLRTGTTVALGAGLDPHIETGGGLTIVPRIFGYLLQPDSRDDSVLYDHADRIEQPDDVTYLITLGDSVRFHDVAPVDGRVVDATDVVASMERYRSSPLVPARTWHETVLDSATAVDARTVRVTTRRPYVYSLAEMGAVSGGAITPRETIEGAADITSGGPGSGPFVVAEFARDHVRLRRHAGYFREGLPRLEGMEFRVYGDDESKKHAFERGEIDVVVHRDAIEAAAIAEIDGGADTVRQSSLSSLALGLRVDRPPLADERVREAIDLALDRDGLIRALAAGEADVLGPVNPHLAGGFWSLPNEEVRTALGLDRTLDERHAAARSLLVAAGAEAVTLRLQVANAPQLIDAATLVRQQLAEVGLTVVLEEIELIRWFANLRAGSFDSTLINHLPYETPDIPARFFHSAGPFANSSPFGFADADIDRLVERSWSEGDRETRRATLLQAQRLMVAGRAVLPLFTGTGYSSARRYVRDRGADLPGSLQHRHHEVWVDGGPTVETD